MKSEYLETTLGVRDIMEEDNGPDTVAAASGDDCGIQGDTDGNSNSETVEGDMEIGIAISHYHQKLGPRFIGIAYDFSNFDSLTRYNILQDSISSRTEKLALFLKNKKGVDFIVFIKKFKIKDPKARGGFQRYAVLIFVPDKLRDSLPFGPDEIAEQIKHDLENKIPCDKILKAWHMLLNDLGGVIGNAPGKIHTQRFG